MRHALRSVFEMDWNGLHWDKMDWNGLHWDKMDWNGLHCDKMDWNGLHWDKMDWNCHVIKIPIVDLYFHQLTLHTVYILPCATFIYFYLLSGSFHRKK